MLIVENESHCDFVKLREMLIRTNMEDLREKTHEKHYELYRKMRLEQVKIQITFMTNTSSENYNVNRILDGLQRCGQRK